MLTEWYNINSCVGARLLSSAVFYQVIQDAEHSTTEFLLVVAVHVQMFLPLLG